MALTVIVIFGAVALFLSLFEFRRRFSLVATAHILTFWLEMFAYQAVSLYLHPRSTDEKMSVIVCLLLLCYIVVFRIGAALVIRAGAVEDILIPFAEETPARALLPWLLIWLVVKAYLVLRYGPLVAFQIENLGKAAGVGYFDEALGSLALYPALGALFIYVIQLGSRPDRFTRPLSVLALPVAMILILSGEVSGARRFVSLLAVLFGLTFLSKRRFVIGPGTVGMACGLALLVVAFSGYYQRIRFNAGSLFVTALRRPLNSFSFMELAEAVFTPYEANGGSASNSNVAALRENLQTRGTPFDLLQGITERETHDYGHLTEGRLLRQAMINVTPRILLEKKESVNADEILSQTYHFPHEDLPTSVLAEMQAEFHFLGYAFTPMVYIALLVLYLRLLRSSAARVSLLGPSFVACMVSLAGALEQGLEKPVVDLRNLIGLCLLGGLVHLLWLAIKGIGQGPVPLQVQDID